MLQWYVVLSIEKLTCIEFTGMLQTFVEVYFCC